MNFTIKLTSLLFSITLMFTAALTHTSHAEEANDIPLIQKISQAL